MPGGSGWRDFIGTQQHFTFAQSRNPDALAVSLSSSGSSDRVVEASGRPTARSSSAHEECASVAAAGCRQVLRDARLLHHQCGRWLAARTARCWKSGQVLPVFDKKKCRCHQGPHGTCTGDIASQTHAFHSRLSLNALTSYNASIHAFWGETFAVWARARPCKAG